MPRQITTKLLKSLRTIMKDTRIVKEQLQAYIIPSGDSHQNEYISSCDARREKISGFSGSAGTAVVTMASAALWTDGRYHLQAAEQTDDNWIVMKDGLLGTPTIAEWLAQELTSENSLVGADPDVLSSSTWQEMEKDLETKGHNLVPVSPNLIDRLWEDRPEIPNNPLLTLDVKEAGMSWQDKIGDVRKEMVKVGVETCIFTALDDIAWLLNLRGSDIPYNPVFYSYVIVDLKQIALFIDDSKLTHDVQLHLGENSDSLSVQLYSYNTFDEYLASHIANSVGKFWLSKTSSEKIYRCIPQKRRYMTEHSHVCVLKSVKNEVEIAGMRNAHYKDAVTLCEYFAWLEKEVQRNSITESQAADKLEQIKREQDDFISLSFDTISSTGSNAAVIHYKPVPNEDRIIDKDSIYLCDSGAQYRDGTTDVTRTVHFGTPSSYEMECYTRVLKGHIALASVVFPQGTKGVMLDTLARTHLWNVGLEYKHGTGHGVGAFLNVHEGPCSVSYKSRPGEIALKPGMIITDEPGYYEDGVFGIRIENCMIVIESSTKYNFKNIGFLELEPITLVPISTKLIDPTILTGQEVQWLNAYHAKCRDVIAPLLNELGKCEALAWLMKETKPIGGKFATKGRIHSKEKVIRAISMIFDCRDHSQYANTRHHMQYVRHKHHSYILRLVVILIVILNIFAQLSDAGTSTENSMDTSRRNSFSQEKSIHPIRHRPGTLSQYRSTKLRTYFLYNRCTKSYIRIFKNTLDTNQKEKKSESARMEFIYLDEDRTKFAIKRAINPDYICFSRRGKLRVERNPLKENRCLFTIESEKDNQYIQIRSAERPSWYMGFKKRGRPMRAWEKEYRPNRAKCFQFKLESPPEEMRHSTNEDIALEVRS